jgi:carbonic anhydrase
LGKLTLHTHGKATRMPLTRIPSTRSHPRRQLWTLVTALCCVTAVWANDESKPPTQAASAPSKPKRLMADITATSSSNPKDIGNQLREALGTEIVPKKKITLVVKGGAASRGANEPEKPNVVRQTKSTSTPATHGVMVTAGQGAPAVLGAPATAPAHGSDVHWDYDGNNGPRVWGQLEPDFALCASGKRQSPINIEDERTLQGPAEPLEFNYKPSNGSVVNNGHTVQVDVQGENTLGVRSSRYRLLQFHFHTPSEEQINGKRAAMVAHLVHRNDEGQLAVVAVLLEPGTANPMIDKVWTYMPLDAKDRVRMPPGLLNLNELLPADQRYYQFMGSLTTPPCSEGVLWMVLKSPMQISPAQYKLFTQLYPMNARPVQAVNGRPVRSAQ